MYTSGCPKNQNKCWYNTGFPPPEGSKKLVLIFRSVNNIVIAPASTGKEVTSKTAVIPKAHTNKGKWPRVKEGVLRAQKIVDKKLIDPKIELAPATWRLKIAISTLAPLWYLLSDRGG